MNNLNILELGKYVPAKFVVNDKAFVMRYPETGIVELDLRESDIIINQLSFIIENKTLLLNIDLRDIDYIEINSQKAFDGGLGSAKGLIFFRFITAVCIHLKTKKCYKFINQDLRLIRELDAYFKAKNIKIVDINNLTEILKDIKNYNDAHYLLLPLSTQFRIFFQENEVKK